MTAPQLVLAIIGALVAIAVPSALAIWNLAYKLGEKASKGDMEKVREEFRGEIARVRLECKADMDRVWERVRAHGQQLEREGVVSAVVHELSRKHTIGE